MHMNVTGQRNEAVREIRVARLARVILELESHVERVEGTHRVVHSKGTRMLALHIQGTHTLKSS